MADGDDGVNARLAIGLEVRLQKFEAALKRAKVLTSDSLNDIERRVKDGEKTFENYGRGHGNRLAKEFQEAGNAASLTRTQMLELAHVTRSVFDGLAAGANPLRLMAMEGGRVAQALSSGPGGVAGALGAIAGMFNPVVAGAVALVVVMGAGALAAHDYEESHNKLLGLFQGLARGARVTVADVEALAEANARAGHATVGASEQFEQAFVHIYGMTRENLGASIAIVNDFAKATGRDSKEALSTLAKAFEDPKNGVVELNRETSSFTQEQVRAIQAMAEGGDKAGALKAILDGLTGTVSGAAEHLSILGKVLKTVSEGFSEAWRFAGAFFDSLVHGPSDEQMVKSLQGQLQRYQATGNPLLAGAEANLQKQIADLQAKIANSPDAKKAAADRKAKDDQEFADSTGITTGLARERLNLKSQLERLNDALKPGGDRHGASDAEINERILQIKRQMQRLDRREGITKPKTIADTSEGYDKSTTDALAKATTDRLQAETKLTDDIRKRAEIEKAAINAAYDKERADLDAKRKEIDAAKGDKNKEAQLAKLDQADAEIDAAQHAKEMAVDAALKAELEKADLERAKQMADANKSLLESQLALADTREERQSIQLQILKLEKDEFDRKLAESRKEALQKDPTNAANINAGFDVLQKSGDSLYANRQQSAKDATKSPWQQWAQEGESAAKNVGDAIQSEAVHAMDSFNAGIADAIVNGKNMRSVFASIFKQMETDLVQYLVKQAEIGAFGGGNGGGGGGINFAQIASVFARIPGFAGGTSFAPGGLALVGENGPELMNVPAGARITPNFALNSVLPNGRAGGGMTIIQGPTFQISGAVMTDELVSQMNAASRAHAQQAAATAVQVARQIIPNDLNRRQQTRLR